MALARLRCGPRAAAWEVFWKLEQRGSAWWREELGQVCGPCRRPCSALPLFVQLDLKDTASRSPSFFCKIRRSTSLGSDTRIFLETLQGWFSAECTQHPSFH